MTSQEYINSINIIKKSHKNFYTLDISCFCHSIYGYYIASDRVHWKEYHYRNIELCYNSLVAIIFKENDNIIINYNGKNEIFNSINDLNIKIDILIIIDSIIDYSKNTHDLIGLFNKTVSDEFKLLIKSNYTDVLFYDYEVTYNYRNVIEVVIHNNSSRSTIQNFYDINEFKLFNEKRFPCIKIYNRNKKLLKLLK